MTRPRAHCTSHAGRAPQDEGPRGDPLPPRHGGMETGGGKPKVCVFAGKRYALPMSSVHACSQAAKRIRRAASSSFYIHTFVLDASPAPRYLTFLLPSQPRLVVFLLIPSERRARNAELDSPSRRPPNCSTEVYESTTPHDRGERITGSLSNTLAPNPHLDARFPTTFTATPPTH
jgi:hypothetical protein